jgi:hypothetical protein
VSLLYKVRAPINVSKLGSRCLVTRQLSCLREYATSRMVAGSSPDENFEFLSIDLIT